LLLSLCLGALPALAATYTVNSLNDVDDATCDGGHCSLKEAVSAANANPGADSIVFSVTGSINQGSQPAITEEVDIDGNRDGITLSQGFAINAGASNVTIRGLTLTNAGETALYVTGSDATIGGPDATDRNNFVDNAGNNGSAIQVSGTGATIENNFINVAGDGTTKDASRDGILVMNGSSGTIIKDNVITSQGGCAVNFYAPGGTIGATTITGNKIGVGSDGTTDLDPSQGICDRDDGTVNGLVTIGDTGGDRNIISGATGPGITLIGTYSGGITIKNNYIGTNEAGTAAIANGSQGISLTGTFGAGTYQIGGTMATEANVISGNTENGISINGGDNWIVKGNVIGLAADGATDLGNGSSGVWISGSSTSVTVGDSTDYNTLSGNTQQGIHVQDATGTLSFPGNYIGVNKLGTAAVANDKSGIWFQNSTFTGTVGDSMYTSPTSVISGNTEWGIRVSGGTVSVYSAIIGLNADQSAAIPNGNGTTGSFDNFGFTRSSGFNVVAGNTGYGILNGGTMKGNYIGVNSAETDVLANGTYGILIDFGAATIGGDQPEEGNVIGGHSNNQILLDTNSLNVSVLGNYIGLYSDGTAIADTTKGLSIKGSNITVGSSEAGGRNYIGGIESGNGISINSSAADSDVEIMGNYIGVAPDGATDRGASGHGINVKQGTNVFIGINAAGDTYFGNLISGNGGAGIIVSGSEGLVDTIHIKANNIGVNNTATTKLANDGAGVRVGSNTVDVFIGGLVTDARNIISGNGAEGIRLHGASAVQIQGNYIGIGTDEITDLGNTDVGIKIVNGGSTNLIGFGYSDTIDSDTGNVINYNGGVGIEIDGATCTENEFRGNSFAVGGAQASRTSFTSSPNNGVTLDGTLVTTANTSRFAGTTDLTGKIDVYSFIGGTDVYEGTATIAAGAFQLDMDFAAAAEDTYLFHITEADGDTTEFSSEPVVADEVLPATPVASGQTTPVNSTDAQTLTITKEAYSSLIRTDVEPDETISTVDADVSEEYSTGVLSEGTNNLTFISKDYSDNSSEILTVTIVVDTTAPSAPAITSAGNVTDTTTTKVYTITGTKEAGTSINNGVTEVVAADAETTWGYDVTLAIGDNVYSFTALDALSNESGATAHTVTYTQDEDAPSAPVITSSIADTTTAAYTFTGTKDANSSVLEDDVVVVALDGLTTWSWETTFSEGANAFSFTSKDALDNESSATLTSITLDTTAPTAATITSATTASGDEATASFTVTGTKEASSSVELSAVEVVAADAATTWSYATTLSVGANLVGPFTVVDALDNTSGETSTTITYTQNDLTPVYYGGGGGGGGGGDGGSSSVSESTGTAATEGTETAVEGSEEVVEEEVEVIEEEVVEEEVVEEEVVEEEVVEEIVEEVVEEYPVYVPEETSLITEVIEVVYEAVEVIEEAAETVSEVAEDLFSAADEEAEPAFVVEVVMELPEETVEVVATRADMLEEEAYAAVTTDADGDQIPDSLEEIYFNSMDVMDLNADTDGDGLTDGEELIMGTDLLSSDSDGDGMSDVEEIAAGTSAVLIDSDADGLTDAQEAELGTSSATSDSDGDGFSDYIEIKYGDDLSGALDASVVIQDDDGDGAPDAWEEEFKMEEVDYAAPQYIAELDVEIMLPMQTRDTDGDGVTDWVEMNRGTDPNDSDSDNDGLSDSDEIYVYLTDPIEKSRDQDEIYTPRIANVREEAVFTGNQATLVGVGHPNAEVKVLFLPHDFVAPTADLVSFGRFLMANLFAEGLAQDIYEQTVQTDASGKFLIQEDLPTGSFDVIIRSYDADGKIVGETLPYEIEVQEELAEGSVTPHRLDDQAIDLTNLQVLNIENSRPLLYGQATKDYTLEAMWASELLSSSLMIDTDKDEGEFVMMAPNNLENGAHEVIVQGIDPLSNLYTAAINLDFMVSEEAPEVRGQNTSVRMKVIGVGLGSAFIVVVLWVVARARKKR